MVVLPKMPLVLKRRVVVTGLGLLTPLGISVEQSWANLTAGKCGIRELTAEDHPLFPTMEVRIGGRLPKEFDLQKWIGAVPYAKNTFNAYATCVATEALTDCNWTPSSESDQHRSGVIFGTSFGCLSSILENQARICSKGYAGMDRFAILKVLINLAAGNLSIQFKLKGPSSTVNTACSAGQTSIGDAFHIIQRGDADLMLTGGAEESLQPFTLAGFSKIGALNSDDNGNADGSSRPFDWNRKGFVLGEGAGAMVLEEMEHALQRKAKIYAEVKAYASNAEAQFLTRPSEDGDGAFRVMSTVINSANMKPEDIDLIKAHGTGSGDGDVSESIAIMRLFKTPGPLITSHKGNIGHLLGASGSVEAAFAVLSIARDEVPGILNLVKPLQLYAGKIRPNFATAYCKKQVRTVLSNAFGFGGVSTSLLFSKFSR